MARQLQLLEPASDWRLDDTTRAVGRKGLAAARAALATARRNTAHDAEPTGAGDRTHDRKHAA